MIERGISDIRTIQGILHELKGAIRSYEEEPNEKRLRNIGNFAGLLEERIQDRRRPGR